jgi:hypothetical protein
VADSNFPMTLDGPAFHCFLGRAASQKKREWQD